MTSLFDTKSLTPLAERLRAQNLTDIVGQEHILSDDGIITTQLKNGKIKSMILWGPPGCGKTTIAKLVAKYVDAEFIMLSAVASGVADLKKVFFDSIEMRSVGKQTILFVDEIHRFNKSQQDIFLPYVEDGTITLIGATTENPSFELNAALLSRCQVVILKRLNENALSKLIERAENLIGNPILLTTSARSMLIKLADGDGRYLLNLIEMINDFHKGEEIDDKKLSQIAQARLPNYDKGGDSHYNLISALHKSVRGSDPDAALYWVTRMIDGGEDMKYIIRRLIRMSIEDIGLADPNALNLAISTRETYKTLGSPEGDLAIANLTIYLATAPKSNAVYVAYGQAIDMVHKTGALPPPLHIINAPTQMMKEQGFGRDYIYDPDTKDGFSGQNYFPDKIPRQYFYQPFERGFERELKKRMEYWSTLRDKKVKK